VLALGCILQILTKDFSSAPVPIHFGDFNFGIIAPLFLRYVIITNHSLLFKNFIGDSCGKL
jgi:hypothetical protein